MRCEETSGQGGHNPCQAGTLLTMQEHPKQSAQAHIPVNSEDLTGETPQFLWAACASALSPAQHSSAAQCSMGAYCVPVCAHFLLLVGTTEKTLWLCPCCTLPAGICTCWWDPPEPLSQNHRKTTPLGWKTYKFLFQPTCYRWGHFPLDQVAQSPIQPGLECFQGGGIHSLSGQHVPVSCHPHSK